MPLGCFGQADELFLHCWSPWLCMTYASPFDTDKSARDKQWWNLRPSPTAREWQVTWETETFLGFIGDFICKLVLKSLQDWQLFRLRLNGIGCFQRWCLDCDKVRQDTSFTFLFTDPWTLKQKVEDPKDTTALSCSHKVKLLVTLTVTDYSIHSHNFEKKNLSISINLIIYNVPILRLWKESTIVLDKNKILLDLWK